MSSKMVKEDIKKTVEKAVVAKKETSKKVSDKSKTETKKVQKDGKKNGRVFKDRSVQTDSIEKVKISGEDLTSEGKICLNIHNNIIKMNDKTIILTNCVYIFTAGPSENYWEVLAERRGIALQDALEENQILHERLKVYKEMLDESRALVEVLQVCADQIPIKY